MHQCSFTNVVLLSSHTPSSREHRSTRPQKSLLWAFGRDSRAIRGWRGAETLIVDYENFYMLYF